ncbi:MAG TPA: hypothetical protein VGL99_28840 [Chloroflexota bacterium]|jgi:hypothetical protein
MAALTGASEPLARHVWTGDLGLEAPGLLLQFGLTPVALAASMAVQPFLTASPIDIATVTGLLVFAGISFLPLLYLVRSSRGR